MTRTTTRGIFRLVAALGLAAVVTIELPVGGPESSPQRTRYRQKSRQVAPGVTLTRIRDRQGPNRISVLRVDLSRTTIDVALAKNSLPGLESTSAMANRRGAIAAINGDYFFTHGHAWTGRPVNTYAEDAELMASPTIWGRNVAIAQDESETFMGHFPLDVSIVEYDTGRVHGIKNWNAGPSVSDDLAGFTPAGGSAMRTPRESCAVRLFPTSRTQWHARSSSIVQDMQVDLSACRTDRVARRRGTVVAAPITSGSGLLLTQSLVPGEVVRLSWSLGVSGVLDTLGGNPMLMENGRLAAGKCEGSSFCLRHPRTGVGVTGNGRLLLAVVDGRWKRSVGMTPAQFARLFRYLGARDAINLDGGGSTTMVVRGSVVNRPSDGHQRKVGNALLVLPSADVREPPMAAAPPPTPTPYLTTSPSPSPSESGLLEDPLGDLPPYGLDTRSSACLAAADPGSIGGYLDYFTNRRDVILDPALRRTLSAFRSPSGMRACL
jgi:hypothetical protein